MKHIFFNVRILTDKILDHVKNCHPKPHQSDSFPYGDGWGDKSSYGERWVDNSSYKDS